MAVFPGILLIFLGGILGGLFTTPMKAIHHWAWENIWLVYSIYGTVRVYGAL